jgi:hypothetical protein
MGTSISRTTAAWNKRVVCWEGVAPSANATATKGSGIQLLGNDVQNNGTAMWPKLVAAIEYEMRLR